MSRVDGIVKILIDEGYSPSQLFENFDEVLAKHEKITYKSGTKSHEFRYIHSGYYKNVIVIDGKYKINYKPANKLPVEEFLKPQKRFKHLFKPGNEWMIEEFQKEVDKRWEALLNLEEVTNK